MKYQKILLLFMITLSCNSFLFSQCPGTPPLDFTFESTESRCESNGTITLHITGGAPFTDIFGNPIYNNTIIAPVVIPVGGQSDSVFTALEADTYTIEVKDANGCSVTHSVMVPGTHIQLELTPTFEDATCDGSIGGWICGTPDEGRPWPPGYYMYELFDASTTPPTSLGPAGLDSCFMNLAAGSYQIRAYDSCQNFQTRDIVLSTKTYDNTFRFTASSRYFLCDTQCVIITVPNYNPPWGEYPYSWEILSSDEPSIIGETGVFDRPAEADTLCFSPIQQGLFVLKVTDQCGNTATNFGSIRGPSTGAGNGFDCVDGGTLTVNSTFTLPTFCPRDSVSFEIYSAPPGAPIPPPQDSGFFPGLQGGTYCVRVTDCCGNVTSACDEVTLPAWTLCSGVSFLSTNCDNETVRFRTCRQSNGGPNPAGLVAIVTSAPMGYPQTLPDTLASSTTYIYGPPGQYCLLMYDECNRRDSMCYQIEPDSLVYDYDIGIIPGCVTGNEITVNYTANFNSYFRITALNPFVYHGVFFDGENLNNLPTGDYRIEYYNSRAACFMFTDTITIPEYEPPAITGAFGIECTNGAGLITVVGSGGNTPYTYELYQGPVTRPIQSSPSFPGLPVGTYDIRMNDNCNNSATTTVSIEPFMPDIQGYGGHFCVGENATLDVDYFDLATYSWTGPNGNTSDTSVLVLSNLTLADAGTYTIDIDVVNPDQTACIAQQLTIDITVIDCNDCQAALDDNLDLCALIDGDPTHPFATLDCDNGGVSNLNECTSGENPLDPSDDCLAAVNNNFNICQLINLDPNHPLASADCDEGGVTNIEECQNGGNPADLSDDCEIATDIGMDICTLLDPDGDGTFDLTHPWAFLDCDNGGVINIDECIAGTDPGAPSDDPTCSCHDAVEGTIDICAILAVSPAPRLATLDCDNGGIDNATECANGGDPLDPLDDCNVAEIAEVDICVMINANPDHPLAGLDCDDGGLLNSSECANGSDPFDPSDDCATAVSAGMDICLLIAADPAHPLAQLDCDNGGVDNYSECRNSGDPAIPGDDCNVAVATGVDICAIIDNDPAHPWATLDCDLGGIGNLEECMNGNDPSVPSDDVVCPIDLCVDAMDNSIDICTVLSMEPSNPLATLDCDGGGVDNATECENNGDPLDPTDDCMAAELGVLDICAMINADPDHPLAGLDCDDGGLINSSECANGSDPFDSADDCATAITAEMDICLLIAADPAHPLAELDCDNGGIDNYTECRNGGDPAEANDDCTTAVTVGSDLCLIIDNDPSHPWATLDCDLGGIDNLTECTNGNDPSNPIDDASCPIDLCIDAMDNSVDICAVLILNPSSPLGTLDCDGGGVDNATECANNGDPLESSDDCSVAETAMLDICAMIAADPTHPLANADCDGGGVLNVVECFTGENPFNQSDDCTAAIDMGLNICQLINYDPNHPLATLDCDMGGVDNFTECNSGGNPGEATDDVESICLSAMSGDTDICALLTADPAHPIGQADCDEGGVINVEECTNGNDPTDPLDDCPDITPITTILPGNIAGASSVGVAVEITELNGIDTDGSAILVRMPSDPRLTFVWNPVLTSVALTPINNANWMYLGNNGVVHTFQYNGPGLIIGGSQTEAFGFESTYDPQSTDGQTTVTASIVPFGGGECNLLNDTDSERLVYFE